jgi:hypothetical protein
MKKAHAAVSPQDDHPLFLRLSDSKAVTQIVRDLVTMASRRQASGGNHTLVGPMMLHLVGAVLHLTLPDAQIKHKPYPLEYPPDERKGDFVIDDTLVYVTVAPTHSLLQEYHRNLSARFRAMIVTTGDCASLAHAVAREANVADRVDVLDIGQYIAMSVLKWSSFARDERPANLRKLVDAYNAIIEACETDPDLKIAIA